MAEPTALRLHDNQSFPDQLGYAVHQTAVQTMVNLKVSIWRTSYTLDAIWALSTSFPPWK
eukprot:scaffold84063_cov36-Attheya_sp.AAC.3